MKQYRFGYPKSQNKYLVKTFKNGCALVPFMDKLIEKKVIESYLKKKSPSKIVKELGIGKTTFYRILKRNGIKSFQNGELNKGQTAWNKGLTKETDERIRKGIIKGVKTRKERGSYKSNSGSFKKGHGGGFPKGRKNPKLSQVRKEMFKKGILNHTGKNNHMYGKKANIKQLESLKLGRLRTGDKNNLWKGGVSPLHKRVRSSARYKKWRKEILKRDKICIDCNSNKNLRAHHIIPFYEIMFKHRVTTYGRALKCKQLWDLNNGELLCKQCHQKHHPDLKVY